MEYNNMIEYLLQQTPVVVIMVVVAFFGFKYFSGQVKTHQTIIEKKDDEIKNLNRESKEDLQKSFSVLQDVNGTLQKWLLKDEQNSDLNKSIAETMANIKITTDRIFEKMSDK